MWGGRLGRHRAFTGWHEDLGRDKLTPAGRVCTEVGKSDQERCGVTAALPAWQRAWLWGMQWVMEEDAAGTKKHPGWEQLKRHCFPPCHREGIVAGSQKHGREEEKRNNLLLSLFPPSGLRGIKHGAESNDTGAGTTGQGQNQKAAMLSW